ncbi:UNVERIFIED_CONTAM: hypothetical protein GTU68_006863 [Idotea baltica]|nr:hypothetical protein [Idotea baltica]
MKKIAIYAQSYAISAEQEIKTLIAILQQNKIDFFIEAQFYALLKKENVLTNKQNTFASFNELDNSFDLMITIGGDGTFLRSVTYVRNLDIPILGINTGRLGFLAIIPKNCIEECFKQILNGEFTLQQRTLLSVKTTPPLKECEELNFALNEVTVAKKNSTSMIGVTTHLDKEFLTNFWADGLIFSTPTGSTGYSLSCNGPVILPNSKTLVITPIAPHNLNVRPMVIPDTNAIKVEVETREDSFLISLDSRQTSVPKNTKLIIEKASFTIKSVLPKNQTFLQTLRSKLLWGEDIRNSTNL